MTTTAPEVRAVTVGTDGEREFAAFVRARQQSLLHAAILLVGDVSAAQDLVQEALIKLAERWEKVERGAEAAYVRRTMYRDSVSRWRRLRRERLYEDPSTASGRRGADHHDPVSAWTAGAEVRAALQQLSPGQRAVMVLRYYEDLSEAQIAQVLGISRGTVKSQASDAVRQLRHLLPSTNHAMTTREEDVR